MKTKYFKSGLFAAAAAMLCVVAVSCADDIEVGGWTDDGSLEGVRQNSGLLLDATTSKSLNDIELWSDSYTTSLKFSLTKIPAQKFVGKAAVDAAYLEQYNATNGTSYELYPVEKVTFSDSGTLAAVGESAQLFSVSMSVAGLDEISTDKTYAIPVAVTSDNGEVTIGAEAGHCLYLVEDMRANGNCFKGDTLPKGFLFIEVNDVNPLNVLSFELENGKLLWDAVVLFAGNINHDSEANRPFLKNNPNVQFLLDNNEIYLQPLRKRGIKVLLGILGNHDQAGVGQLSDRGARDFAAELARYCEAYNIDGVNFDDEYSSSPDLSNPAYTRPSYEAAARLCYETKMAMPDKMVTVYTLLKMNPGQFPIEIEGVPISKWLDVVVPDYGGASTPRGDMTYGQCAGMAMEFSRGGGGNLSAAKASTLIGNGYGWFMGFSPDPMKTLSYSNTIDKAHWQNIFNRLVGAETLYGSPLKAPTIFYKKNDTTIYRYPEDLPDTK